MWALIGIRRRRLEDVTGKGARGVASAVVLEKSGVEDGREREPGKGAKAVRRPRAEPSD